MAAALRSRSSAAPATRAADCWALFERTVLMTEVAADPAAAAACAASNGGQVRVSLRVAKPPASSYVEMHIDADLRYGPSVVASDGDLLLIHAVVAVRDPPPCCYQDNLFVYRAHPVSPALLLLPQLDDDESLRDPGIACRAGGEFVVANLQLQSMARLDDDEGTTREEVAVLSRFSSFSKGGWEVKQLRIPFDNDKGLYPQTWYTDKVFTFRGSIMCWVDYHRGFLHCDVFADTPELRFVQLPGIEVWDDMHDYTCGRQLPASHRTVEASQGLVKFVDADNGHLGRTKSSGFSVTSWTLTDLEMETWEKDCVLQVDDLWSLEKFRDSPLPRWVPEYPVVSKSSHDLLHFVLRGPCYNAKAWMISVDMRQKLLESYMPYTNHHANSLPKETEDVDVDLSGLFPDTAFVCSDLCNDLSRNADVGN